MHSISESGAYTVTMWCFIGDQKSACTANTFYALFDNY